MKRIFLLWTLFWLVLLLAGCTTAWTGEATSIIALLGPAISSLIGILAAFGLGVSPAVMKAVNDWSARATTGLAEVKELIEKYEKAEAAAQPGLLVEIQTALETLTAGLSQLLPTIKVTDPNTQAKIVAIFTAVETEMAALVSLVPALQGKVTEHEKVKALIAQVKTAKEFKHDFNAKAAPFGKRYEI